MIMSPTLRKLALIVHITASVGWIGAVVAYLVLVVAAMTGTDTQILRAVWLAMELIGWLALVPLAWVSLLTGILMSVTTRWGLFQHYWVLFSFFLTIVATLVLLEHMQTVSLFADIAAQMDSTNLPAMSDGLQSELLHGGVGLLILMVVQVLNVYKPRGLTPHGWRKQKAQRAQRQPVDAAI